MTTIVNGIEIELTPEQIAKVTKVSAAERFWQLMNGCTIYTEKENPNSVFCMKDGKIWFELEKSTLWCQYNHVWSVFEKEYSLGYSEIQSLIKLQVEERFKMKGITPLFG